MGPSHRVTLWLFFTVFPVFLVEWSFNSFSLFHDLSVKAGWMAAGTFLFLFFLFPLFSTKGGKLVVFAGSVFSVTAQASAMRSCPTPHKVERSSRTQRAVIPGNKSLWLWRQHHGSVVVGDWGLVRRTTRLFCNYTTYWLDPSSLLAMTRLLLLWSVELFSWHCL